MAPLCLVLSLLSAAVPLSAAGPTIYPAPNGRWTAALEAPVAAYGPASLGAAAAPSALAKIAGFSADRRAVSLGPVVRELQRGFHLTAEKFAALSPADQRTALELAAEQAQAALTQRSYELIAHAQAQTWSKDSLDREELKSLYRVASHLSEIRRHYGAYLEEGERDAVAAAAAQAGSRYRQARADYVRRFGLRIAGELNEVRDPAAAEAPPKAAAAERPRPPPIEGTTAARKLLERMRETKTGWGERDIETVYLGHGFTYRDGAKHRVYSHPSFPHLRTSVSRQTELKPPYVRDAIRLIEEAVALSAPAAVPALAAAAAGAADADEPLPSLPPAPAAKREPRKRQVARVELGVQALAREAAAEPEPAVAAPVAAVAPAAAEPEPVASAPVGRTPTPAPTAAGKSGWRRLLEVLRGED